jgi:hypothetical protein
MPTLSIFFGIVIRMYYDDHPPPHFHAIYGEHEAKIGIETLELIDGSCRAGPSGWFSTGPNFIKNFINRSCAIIGSGGRSTTRSPR